MRLPLGAHDIHVRFRLLDDCVGDGYADALPLLSSEERERAERFVFPRDRLTYAAAHAMLRRTLSDYEDVPPDRWNFARTAHGKPVLAGAHARIALGFNLAHTHGLIACAVCRDAVGIDVESLDRRVPAEEIAARYFARAEVASLQRCPAGDRHARFVELWTLKEAYIKAIGDGLSHPLDTFSFRLDGGSSIRFETAVHEEAAAWEFRLFAPSAQHRMAVAARCLPAARRRITVRDDEGRSASMLRGS